MESLIPKELTKLIEQIYYHDLNVAENWEQLLKQTQLFNGNFQQCIEWYSMIGEQNIHRFLVFSLNKFEEYQTIYFPQKKPDELNFIKKYLMLICFLANIDISCSLQKKLINYDDLDKIIKKIIDSQFFENNISENFISSILILPFLFNHFIELVDALKKNNAKEIIKDRLVKIIDIPHSKLNQIENDLFNLLSPNHHSEKVYEQLIIPTLNIFYLLKKIFFNTDQHKIYGYYQQLIDKQSGNALYSIPFNKKMLLLHGSSALIAGEKNIADIEIINQQNILIRFNNGRFIDDTATGRAALNTALAIHEHFIGNIQEKNNTTLDYLIPNQVLLETPSDNLRFAQEVYEQLCFLNTEYHKVIKILPTLHDSPLFERNRFLNNINNALSNEIKIQILEKIRETWEKPEFRLTNRAFENVILIELKANDILVNEGDKANFIYLPLEEGLKGTTAAGNDFFPKPLVPIGHIGVIQNGNRTATITALKPLELLMIPGTTYLSYWHMDYNESEFKKILTLDAIE